MRFMKCHCNFRTFLCIIASHQIGGPLPIFALASQSEKWTKNPLQRYGVKLYYSTHVTLNMVAIGQLLEKCECNLPYLIAISHTRGKKFKLFPKWREINNCRKQNKFGYLILVICHGILAPTRNILLNTELING